MEVLQTLNPRYCMSRLTTEGQNLVGGKSILQISQSTLTCDHVGQKYEPIRRTFDAEGAAR
jgi:hypothetical protein